MAVTEMGGIVSGAFGGASGTMPLASPSKRPRSGSQAALGAAGAPGAAGGLLRGSGSGTAPSLAGLLPGSQGQQLQQLLGGAGPGPGSMRLGLMPNSRQTVFQQVGAPWGLDSVGYGQCLTWTAWVVVECPTVCLWNAVHLSMSLICVRLRHNMRSCFAARAPLTKLMEHMEN